MRSCTSFFSQDKKQIAGKNSTKTTLHNGVSDDNFSTNNNDQSKRIKLDQSDQPPPKVREAALIRRHSYDFYGGLSEGNRCSISFPKFQQANGDLSAAKIEADKVAEKPVNDSNDAPKETSESQDKEKPSSNDEVKLDASKPSAEESKTVPEKDQEKAKV